MSVGEYLVRGNLVAARVLNVLDPQQEHYHNNVTAEVADIKGDTLEIIVGNQVRGPLSSNTANLFRQARQNLRPQVNHQLHQEEQQWDVVGNFLGLIEAVMTGHADQTAYAQIQQHLNGLRRVGFVGASIPYAVVRADNTRLRQEAMHLAGQGEQAANLVVQHLDEVLEAERTNGRGAFGRFPAIGEERNVRDYFFIHNLLRGEGWGLVMTESGWLLLEGGKHREALDELLVATHLGYDDPAVKLGIAKARDGLGELDGAIAAYNAVLGDMPVDQETNTALERLYRQKAAQTRRSVESLIVPHEDLLSARSMLTADSIEAAAISNSQKASQLYQLAAAYLSLEPRYVDGAIPLLRRSLELEPRKETYLRLADAHSRIARGELSTPPAQAGYHPTAGHSILGRAGQAICAVALTPVHLRTPVTFGRR